MNKEGYLLLHTSEFSRSFVSNGKNGAILKAVVFQEIAEHLYNVALMDYLIEVDSFSDNVHSNNGDMPKVLATVVGAMKDFLELKPNAVLYFEGNTRVKQLLYNRIVRNNIDILLGQFNIEGQTGTQKELYSFGNEYDSFYIYLKQKDNE